MKSNKLGYLSLLVSSAFMLSGCASMSATEKQDKEIKTNILKTMDDAVINNKAPEPIIETVPVLVTKAPAKKEKRFNLVVNKAPVEAILHSLVDGTSYSLIMPEDIQGTISLNLKNVSAFEVLEILKNSYHYDYEVNDKIITFYPNGIRSKFFVVNHLIGKRKGSSELKVSAGSLTDSANNNSGGNNSNGGSGNNNNSNNNNNSGTNSGESETASTKISTTTDSDFWTEIEKVLNTMIGNKDGRSVVVSQETNSLLIKASSKEINEVEKYLRKIQAIIDKQVVIEAKIIEVELNDSMQTGINWAAFKNANNHNGSLGFGSSGTKLNPNGVLNNNSVSIDPGSNLNIGDLSNAASIFSLGFQTSNFAAILSFLETQGSLQVLSSPRIATLNNQKAILKVGTDEFFVTNVSTTNTSTSSGTSSTPSVTTQPFFSGIALDITPQIDDNGLVAMHVHPSVSKVSTVVKNINLGSSGNIVLPLASSTISETDSIVKIENNKIVAIGGLMKQYSKKEKSQIPGIGNAPVVGEAFKNVNNESTKYELVILIKPQIITTQADWETNLAAIRNRLADFDSPKDTIVLNGNSVSKK